MPLLGSIPGPSQPLLCCLRPLTPPHCVLLPLAGQLCPQGSDRAFQVFSS